MISTPFTMPKAKQRLRCSQQLSFCPYCGKRFANEMCVLQHMNQPSSVCGSWMNSLPHFAPAPQRSRIPPLATTQHHPDHNFFASPKADDADVLGGFGGMKMSHTIQSMNISILLTRLWTLIQIPPQHIQGEQHLWTSFSRTSVQAPGRKICIILSRPG